VLDVNVKCIFRPFFGGELALNVLYNKGAEQKQQQQRAVEPRTSHGQREIWLRCT
jgi:hypothetical protein